MEVVVFAVEGVPVGEAEPEDEGMVEDGETESCGGRSDWETWREDHGIRGRSPQVSRGARPLIQSVQVYPLAVLPSHVQRCVYDTLIIPASSHDVLSLQVNVSHAMCLRRCYVATYDPRRIVILLPSKFARLSAHNTSTRNCSRRGV